jgi:dihydrofolate reductase
MNLSLIVAVADNGIIGRDNELPWHLPRDLKRFKSLTMGHHLLLGRKTFEAIGRSLPGRTMIVLSRQKIPLPELVQHASSLDQAIDIARANGETEAFVAGGEEIYRLALARAGRIYLTRVHCEVEGDVRFPEIDREEWTERSREHYPMSEDNRIPLTFFVLERVKKRL